MMAEATACAKPKPPRGDKDFLEVMLNHEEPTRRCLIRKSAIRKATQALGRDEITLTFWGETYGDKDCRFDMPWETFVRQMKDTGPRHEAEIIAENR